MKTKLFFLIALLIQLHCFAQAPAIQWQKVLGGDMPEEIQNTSDGGYIFISRTTKYNTDSSGAHTGGISEFDIWVVKLNATGTIQWQKCLGGTGLEAGKSIKQTSDGGYIILGSTTSKDGDVTGIHMNGTSASTDIWVVKLNSSGAIVWQKTLGGSAEDIAYSIEQTMDGGYILVGDVQSNDGDIVSDRKSYYYNAWVVKLNATGNIQWQKLLGGTYEDYGRSILQTADGGYIVGCAASSFDGDVTRPLRYEDFWIVKLNSSGNIEWQKAYGGSEIEELNRIIQTKDGGFIAVGITLSNDGDVVGFHGFIDIWVIKISATGTLEWQKTLGGTKNDRGGKDYGGFGASIIQTKDGGYLVGGDTMSNDGDVSGNHNAYSPDAWVVKLSNTGAIQWQKCLGGSNEERSYSIVQTADNGYLMVGLGNSYDGDLSAITDHNKTLWILKLAPEVLSTTGFDKNSLAVYPNPSKNQINLQFPNQVIVDKIIITDLTGKIILEQTAKTTSVNTENLAKGMYFIQAFSGKEKFTSKFIKE